MRLIDADRLEREWNQHKTMIDNVDAQPTVDTIKHAHWMTDDYEVSYTCSACGWAILFRKPTNYCPHCGAKMDEAIK